ncbi:SDR family NAD(P)-dependent oxidoreductase [Croceicoccus bisphenolivorans]|uniref:SDR family NAD(P)-dependent oxidoreductase n=1 Tax=Croceicoccus bisphenolivorans TaxID=1783232 RepID=UPI0008353703|nr:SDR family NAD(P)-dependent oxidoreductase [Croceicoccus bisphenolivorans]
MDLGLANKVVIITGAGKGMGPEITKSFCYEGSLVSVLGRDLSALEILKEKYPEYRDSISLFSCDVTKADDCDRAVAEVVSKHGQVDVLVNVAGGTGPVGIPAWETSPEAFEEIVRLNMAGCFHMMRAVLPPMIARHYGKIVNVGGTFGMHGRAGRMAYSASKWGLRGITKSTAIEAGPHNINVNIVAPGMVDGPRFRTKVMPGMAAARGITEEQAIDEHASEYALRRISQAQDVANACMFLASDVSRQITGVDLPVDGGWAAL